MSTPGEGEENSSKLLRIFSQETEQEMTAALKPVEEGEAYIMEFANMYEELESLEIRVMVQIFHIQQVNLETDRGAYKPEERLEGVGDMPTQEES
jgi:hypothetical protein